MKKIVAFTDYFSRNEKLLWGISVILIVISFCMFDRENYLTLVASLIGVTSLIFNAKGNPVVVCFGAFFANDIYGFISWRKMEKRQAENVDREE